VSTNAYRNHPTTEDARWKRVRKNLGRLCTKGVDPWVIIDETSRLLDLHVTAVAADRISKSAEPMTEKRLALGFTNLLRELVTEFRGDPLGEVLQIVMALDETYTDREGQEHHLFSMNVTQRRKLAGQNVYLPYRTFESDTIRMTHEPDALDRLYVMMMRREVLLSGVHDEIDGEGRFDNLDRMLIYLPRELVPTTASYWARDISGSVLDNEILCKKGDGFPRLPEGVSAYGWGVPEDEADIIAELTSQAHQAAHETPKVPSDSR
jgi:hypothetical protein